MRAVLHAPIAAHPVVGATRLEDGMDKKAKGAWEGLRRDIHDDLFRAAFPDSLDAAWVEAEAALPKGCHLVLRGRSAGPRRSSDEIPTIGYRAAAFCGSRDIGPFADWWDTPVAALRALIVKLRDHGKTVIPTTEDITPDESRGERLMVGDELLPPGTVGRRPR